ncbi:hypothetical protein BDV96DRAFT_593657 [Lophiotrema nucula]|uniref:Uncharacterized protein n=1 Tax=Lophiotrema nucula TaxID=690887 RepID=A0A6A5ZUP3_9PLEO|nr:hypothetical protein BDV96DRAFT_593657 [Lophiotrema nucula]
MATPTHEESIRLVAMAYEAAVYTRAPGVGSLNIRFVAAKHNIRAVSSSSSFRARAISSKLVSALAYGPKNWAILCLCMKSRLSIRLDYQYSLSFAATVSSSSSGSGPRAAVGSKEGTGRPLETRYSWYFTVFCTTDCESSTIFELAIRKEELECRGQSGEAGSSFGLT